MLDKAIADVDGRPSQPYRTIDPVESLLRCGAITSEMANAADEFRRAFRVAHMDDLRAADMARIPGVYGKQREPPMWAKRRVQDTITALGGVTRAPGSCAWHVMGLEWSIARWALEQLGRNRAEARGVLIATVAFLEAWGSGRRSAA